MSQRPSFEPRVIRHRLTMTAEAIELARGSLPPELGAIRDVRQPVSLAGKEGQITGEDLYRIADTLRAIASFRKYLMAAKASGPTLWQLGEHLPYLPELANEIFSAVSSDGDVLDSASSELKKLRSQKSTQQKRIVSKLRAMVSGAYRPYLQEPIFTTRSGRYVLPIKAQYRGKVAGIVHDASASGQTLFVEPQSVIEEDDKLRITEAAEREEVSRILVKMSRAVGAQADQIITGVETASQLDVVFAQAYYAQDAHCTEPQLAAKAGLRVRAAHHPLLDRSTSVPITVSVGFDGKGLLITGPNTGGKTVTLKILGLYSLLIGCGVFPPADHVTYGPFSGVWADIGDEQSLQQSLSTFSGHLRNLAEIFAELKSDGLVLLDEVGAGTDPREGAALGMAILSEISARGAIVAASTHFGELKNFATSEKAFECAAMEFDVESLRPTYRLLPGAAGASHALEIARRYGVPDEVVSSAERYMGSEAMEERRKSSELDRELKRAREDSQKASMLREELEVEQEKLEDEREEVRAKVHKIRARAEDALQEALIEVKRNYRELLDKLGEFAARGQITEAERLEFVAAGQALPGPLESLEEEFAITEKPNSEIRFEQGDSVILTKTNRPGRVIQVLSNGMYQVQVGGIKLKVTGAEIVQGNPRRAASQPKPKLTSRIQARIQAKTEIQLRRLRADEAVDALDRFFDEATLAGVDRVRIVHGKGEGVLRTLVQDFLRKRKDVKEFREGEAGEGGSGVTIVYFK